MSQENIIENSSEETNKPFFNEESLERLRKSGIYLMTPCYGGNCTSGFTESVVSLAMICAINRIPFSNYFINNESLIPRARNYCVYSFLNEEIRVSDEETFKFQTGVFIDSDIYFNPYEILHMAILQTESSSNYDVLCGFYPKKTINWDRIITFIRDNREKEIDPKELCNMAGDFILHPLESECVLGKPVKLDKAGTGLMMVQRSVFERLDSTYDLKYYPDHSDTQFQTERIISAYFNCIIDQDKRFLSEDYYFCDLCKKAGIDIWGLVYVNAVHIGNYSFSGDLIEQLIHRAKLEKSEGKDEVQSKNT